VAGSGLVVSAPKSERAVNTGGVILVPEAGRPRVGHGMIASVDASPTFPPIRLRSVVFDCEDPNALATFYAALLDGRKEADDADWYEVRLDDPAMTLSFQRVDSYRAPEWPDGMPQQLHLDLTVTDLAMASARAVALGAEVLGDPVEEEGGTFMVHADPAGHPFCFVVEGARQGTS
jgi:predicted enzyme related to lactoylglutathione lyase